MRVSFEPLWVAASILAGDFFFVFDVPAKNVALAFNFVCCVVQSVALKTDELGAVGVYGLDSLQELIGMLTAFDIINFHDAPFTAHVNLVVGDHSITPPYS